MKEYIKGGLRYDFYRGIFRALRLPQIIRSKQTKGKWGFAACIKYFCYIFYFILLTVLESQFLQKQHYHYTWGDWSTVAQAFTNSAPNHRVEEGLVSNRPPTVKFSWHPFSLANRDMLTFRSRVRQGKSCFYFRRKDSVEDSVCGFWFRYIKRFHRIMFNPKRAGGGRNPPPPLRHFLLYLCRLLFFRAETSWLFFFKPCARFKTICIKIGHRVMTRRCVIARWVQRKTDFPLKLHTNRVFCLFCLSGYTSTMFYLIYLVYLE